MTHNFIEHSHDPQRRGMKDESETVVFFRRNSTPDFNSFVS
jgi:hypothetical protein